MLQSIHVKNLALIREAQFTLGPGLNIFTGETGAGKSLLLSALHLALGGRFEASMQRQDEGEIWVELVFCRVGQEALAKLEELGLPLDEDGVCISRRISQGRNTCRINGEMVQLKTLKDVGALLLDIHGQHEHQSLLGEKKQRNVLDGYCQEALSPYFESLGGVLARVKSLRRQLQEESKDEQTRMRERQLYLHALEEIEQASMAPGDDLALEEECRRLARGEKGRLALEECGECCLGEESGAGALLSRALRALAAISPLEGLEAEIYGDLQSLDAQWGDLAIKIARALEERQSAPGALEEARERLERIELCKHKYGGGIEAVLEYAGQARLALEALDHYEERMEGIFEELKSKEAELVDLCKSIHLTRKAAAEDLGKELAASLAQLHFLQVDLSVEVEATSSVGPRGYDRVEILLSTNPGQPKKPLGQVASGGELSRIMLALKTVLAAKDPVDTLIFDEVDSGISGQTAWKVAAQLGRLAAAHQVICITHLPQMAAMADVHFLISKSLEGAETRSHIALLGEEESLRELGRMLTGEEVTEAVLENARELRLSAQQAKSS